MCEKHLRTLLHEDAAELCEEDGHEQDIGTNTDDARWNRDPPEAGSRVEEHQGCG